METNKKLEHALRCIKLGMSIYDSLFIAECTDKEIEEAMDDEDFLKVVQVTQKIEEMELLKKHNVALSISAQRGNTKPIEWKLEKLNKERWGTKVENVIPPIVGNISVNLKGVEPVKENANAKDA